MKSKISRTLTVFSGLLIILSVTACNTIAGVGEDVEATGGAIEEEAEEN